MQSTKYLQYFVSSSEAYSSSLMIGRLQTTVAFFAGALTSVAAGFSGMRAATSANGRTAMAAKSEGQSGALAVSYNGGAVMGLSVGGLGLLGISLIAFWLGAGETNADGSLNVISAAAGFGMGRHRLRSSPV